MDIVIDEFEAITKDAERVQRETLRRILEDNTSAEYLQNLGLNGRTDLESFKALVPPVTHKDLEPFIMRIIDGEASSILTGQPIKTVSLSSGTTGGKPKFIPFNDELYETAMQINLISSAFRDREFPIKKGKALSFLYSSKQFKTKGGLTAGTFSTNVMRHEKTKSMVKQMEWCSPKEVIFGPDFQQSLYCHLLCGLIFSEEVQLVSSAFAHSIVQAFRTFEQVWQELCTDIREGVLINRVTVPSIRTAMSKLLKPNPELANLIEHKCKGLNNWYGLIPELFPNTKYIHGIMTGSMEPYVTKLKHYAGDLPLLTGDYTASEGCIASNVNPNLLPELATYAVLPHSGYFEFIPLSESQQHNGGSTLPRVDPQPVGLTQVKIGEEYEIMITNAAGLYRYKLGDVVKVMGFHNSTPELKFIRRSCLLLTINIDKNTEIDLQVAVAAAAKLIASDKLEVVDYTSHVDVSSEPGHYVIFWEINGEASAELLSECCNCMDKSFLDAGYTTSRRTNGIGPLELCVLRRGTFQKIQDHMLGFGATAFQYKTPRCIGPRHRAVLQILSENVMKSYLSAAY
ncbi:hypothetical protein QN277_023814 [Acacia crassicarpa]|uniref:Jasmonic acid-amido synthetase JAR1 n=1 Tax=Acacia crassicarpa TaxID=499986 RepID=A0AAE1K6J8_9FABA|nr:hypothetical protein QN277_023814 [Acacia crassicarpa]